MEPRRRSRGSTNDQLTDNLIPSLNQVDFAERSMEHRHVTENRCAVFVAMAHRYCHLHAQYDLDRRFWACR